MGSIIFHKGILLDEQDLGAPHKSMEALSDRVCNVLLETLDPARQFDYGYPELEIFGFASERFEATDLFHGECSPFPNWLDAAGDFRSAILKEITLRNLPDPDAVLREDTEALRARMTCLQRQICEQVMNGGYGEAENLLSNLRHIEDARLCFEPQDDLEWDNEEAIFDFREARYEPGTRLLAEIGFNWGQ